jgi:hypothetical protein
MGMDREQCIRKQIRWMKLLLVLTYAIVAILGFVLGGLIIPGCEQAESEVLDGTVTAWHHKDDALVYEYGYDVMSGEFEWRWVRRPEEWSVDVVVSNGDTFSRNVRQSDWSLYKQKPEIFVQKDAWGYGIIGPAHNQAEEATR